MTKRYREVLETVETAAASGAAAPGAAASGESGRDGAPTAFWWRGQQYHVLQVLGHWREDPGWWRRADGEPIRIEQTDLWRVEARNGAPSRGVYELVRREGDRWSLDRVWD